MKKTILALSVLLTTIAPVAVASPQTDFIGEFTKQQTVCIVGGIRAEYKGYRQCQSNGIRVSVEAMDNYRAVTVTVDGNANHQYTQRQVNLLVGAIKTGLKQFGYDESIAESFRDLPLSDDWNKPTIIGGVKFNIPSLKSFNMYNNYMVTLTK